jgi:hypothetical protein
LSGCRNLDVAAQRYAVMTTWSNPRAEFPTPYATVPLILCVQWVKVGDDCSFLVPYRRKPKGNIVLGFVRPSVRPSVRLSVRPSVCPSVRPSVCPSVRHVNKFSGPFFYVLWYIDLIFGMWLYLDELRFKFEFCSGRMIIGWDMALELVFIVQILSYPNFFWRPLRYWLAIWYVAISRWITV